MKIEFNQRNHKYFINGEIASLSITELLAKHGLAPSYDGVNPELLAQKASYGTAIHKDLENFINGEEPTTTEGNLFKSWLSEKEVSKKSAEELLGLDYKGLYIGGTADLIATLNNEVIIGDHKTTSRLHKETVQWQLSLYDYMARKMCIIDKPADRLLAFHYQKDAIARLNVVELERVPDDKIEELLECELNGELYQKPLLNISRELVEKTAKVEKALKLINEEKKAIEKAESELKSEIIKLFEEQNIKSWESEDKAIQITYKDAYSRTTVDSKALKNNYPDVYKTVEKTTITKPSLVITLRGE